MSNSLFAYNINKLSHNVRLFDLSGVELRGEIPPLWRFSSIISRTVEQMRETALPEGFPVFDFPPTKSNKVEHFRRPPMNSTEALIAALSTWLSATAH